MVLDRDLSRLLRDNPDWRSAIVEAVEELVGDPMFRWDEALAVLAVEGAITVDSLRDPWISIEDRSAAFGLETELRKEVADGHRLWPIVGWAVARRRDRDEVLFRLSDGRWAIVHLTWANHPESPPWPATTVYGSLAEAKDRIDRDIDPCASA